MKLHLNQDLSLNTITGYGADHIMINKQRYEGSMIVTPERIIDDWRGKAFDTLSAADFDYLAGLDAEIVLLGTGARLRFPHPRLTQALMKAHIGLETMDTGAACRTYNILMSEGRRVAAALLFDPPE